MHIRNGDIMAYTERRDLRLVESDEQLPDIEHKREQKCRANTVLSISNFSSEGEHLNADLFVSGCQDGGGTSGSSVKFKSLAVVSEASDIISLHMKTSSATTAKGEPSEATDIKSTFD